MLAADDVAQARLIAQHLVGPSAPAPARCASPPRSGTREPGLSGIDTTEPIFGEFGS